MTDREGILQKYIEYSTPRIGVKYYCPYCGKELEEDEEWEEYEKYTYRFCNCEDAKKEREIMYQIRQLEAKLPKAKYEIGKQIMKIGEW